jgi:hypothetical protein
MQAALNSQISSATPTRVTAQLTKSKTVTDPANAGLPLGSATHTAMVLPRTSVLTFAASTTMVATVLKNSAKFRSVATGSVDLAKHLQTVLLTVMPPSAPQSLRLLVMKTAMVVPLTVPVASSP